MTYFAKIFALFAKKDKTALEEKAPNYLLCTNRPPLSRQQDVSLSQSFLMPPVDLTKGRWRGGGEEPNHTTERKPELLQIIQYSLMRSSLVTDEI
jgi:hypothetical protein